MRITIGLPVSCLRTCISAWTPESSCFFWIGFFIINKVIKHKITISAIAKYKKRQLYWIVNPAIKGPNPTPKAATAPKYPNFLGISGPGGVMSVINAIKIGLTKPKPIPPNIFAIMNINSEIEAEAVNIPNPKIINPKIITLNLPFTSETAPENNWIIANGTIKAGIDIKIAFGVTSNSVESTPKRTKITFPVTGPKPKRRYIINLVNLFSLFELIVWFIRNKINYFKINLKKTIKNLNLIHKKQKFQNDFVISNLNSTTP